MIDLDLIRGWLDQHGFRPTRHDGRRTHETGFDADGNELRSVRPGSNESQVLKANRGVDGPIAVESSYAGGIIRIKLYHGTRRAMTWDLRVRDEQERFNEWCADFEYFLQGMLDWDRSTRERWTSDQ